MQVGINCDMGESFSLYKLGDDEGIMPFITEANIACGFHASDPNHMRATVELAKSHDVKTGAHFSLPDQAGFGRREMKIARDELANIIIYQIGALKAFLDIAGVPLNHLKPHGALYGMACRQEAVAHAIADAAVHHGVPVFGMAGTVQEDVYLSRDLEFRSEYFCDLDYDDNGALVITRTHDPVDPETAAERCLRAVMEGKSESINGKELAVRADTVCVHSDTPNAVEVASAVRNVLEPYIDQNRTIC